MKELIFILGGIFFYQALMAQTFSEWFRQNHTQLSHLQEQIAALQAYQVAEQTGYAVSEDGLLRIDSTAVGDCDQQAVHISSLHSPSGGVLTDPRIREIDTLLERAAMIANAVELLGPWQNDDGQDWKALSTDMCNQIDASALSVEGRLMDLLSAGVLTMSDAEREKAISILQVEARTVYNRAVWCFNEFTDKTMTP